MIFYCQQISTNFYVKFYVYVYFHVHVPINASQQRTSTPAIARKGSADCSPVCVQVCVRVCGHQKKAILVQATLVVYHHV